jgi:hypothetical protein
MTTPRRVSRDYSSSSDEEYDKVDKKTPINVFFSEQGFSKGTSDTKNKNDNYGAYIIHQNNELHQKLSDLKKKYNSVVVERDFFEQEVDALTKSKTCLQGYMKNELALTESWKYLSEKYIEGIDQYYYAWMFCLVEYIILLALVFTFSNNSNFSKIIMFMYVPMSLVYNILKVRKNAFDFKYNPLIKDAKNNILRIEKANIYVLELIDNI